MGMSKPLVINKASTQLAEAMKEQGITALEMAKRLKTSDRQVGRLLNPDHNHLLSCLGRAAAIFGLRVKLTLI